MLILITTSRIRACFLRTTQFMLNCKLVKVGSRSFSLLAKNHLSTVFLFHSSARTKSPNLLVLLRSASLVTLTVFGGYDSIMAVLIRIDRC
jgi:hypothetical protein